jgi:hypothetical protein
VGGGPPHSKTSTGTSIGSDFPNAFDAPLKALNPTLNPHMRYFDGSRRGYLLCTVDRHTLAHRRPHRRHHRRARVSGHHHRVVCRPDRQLDPHPA